MSLLKSLKVIPVFNSYVQNIFISLLVLYLFYHLYFIYYCFITFEYVISVSVVWPMSIIIKYVYIYVQYSGNDNHGDPFTEDIGIWIYNFRYVLCFNSHIAKLPSVQGSWFEF